MLDGFKGLYYSVFPSSCNVILAEREGASGCLRAKLAFRSQSAAYFSLYEAHRKMIVRSFPLNRLPLIIYVAKRTKNRC